MRLDRPIGWWLLLFPGWWGIAMAAFGGHGSSYTSPYAWAFYYVILFWVGAILMRGAGCIINDLWDRDLDAKVERTKMRPLASGEVKIWQAGILLFALLFVSLIILLQMPWTTIKLGFLSILPVIIYPYMKRITCWPQLFLGLTFNFSALMGWSVMTGDVSLSALLLYLGCIFWTLGYDTIYAHQDKEDDALIGIKSAALFLGKNSKPVIALFYIMFFMLLSTSIVLSTQIIIAPIFFIPAAMHLVWQLMTWDMNDNQNSLRMFKSNCVLGFLVLGGIMLTGVTGEHVLNLINF